MDIKCLVRYETQMLDLFPTSEMVCYEMLVQRLVCLFGLGSSGTREHQEPAGASRHRGLVGKKGLNDNHTHIHTRAFMYFYLCEDVHRYIPQVLALTLTTQRTP